MTAAEIVTELRSARPVASEALRLRVTEIAAAGPAPRPSRLAGWRRRRRTLAFALAATAALAIAAAGAIGFERSGDSQLSAVGEDAKRQAQYEQRTELAAPTVGQAAQDSAAKAPAGAGTTTGPAPTPGRAQRYSATLTLEVPDA